MGDKALIHSQKRVIRVNIKPSFAEIGRKLFLHLTVAETLCAAICLNYIYLNINKI